MSSVADPRFGEGRLGTYVDDHIDACTDVGHGQQVWKCFMIWCPQAMACSEVFRADWHMVDLLGVLDVCQGPGLLVSRGEAIQVHCTINIQAHGKRNSHDTIARCINNLVPDMILQLTSIRTSQSYPSIPRQSR